jgi:thiol-disulfide isomerase/thioredoxin
VNLQDFKGKRIFMNLWATWCPPCVAEMPSIQNLYNKTSGKAAFVMLSFDDDFGKAKSFVARKQFSMPIYYAAGPLPNLLNVDGIPTTYIFDENGKLIFSQTGMSDYSDEKFVALLTATQ